MASRANISSSFMYASYVAIRLRLIRDVQQHLAEVISAKKPRQGSRCILESADDGFQRYDFAAAQQKPKLGQRSRKELLKLHGRKALPAEPLPMDRTDIEGPTAAALVISGDLPAFDHTGGPLHLPHHHLGQGATDVIEIDVRPGGHQFPQLPLERCGAIIQRGVEAQLLLQYGALLVRSGESNDARAANLGDLADDRADAAGGAGNQHGLTSSRPRNFESAEVSGESGDSENVEGAAMRLYLRIQKFQASEARQVRIRAPVAHLCPFDRTVHDLPGRVSRIPAFEDARHAEPHQRHS